MDIRQPIDRRSFIQAMITACTACFFLPGAFRQWKSLWLPELTQRPQIVTPQDFTDFLIRQTPVYDKLVLQDIGPNDAWIGQVVNGPWPSAYDFKAHEDRLSRVLPKLNENWKRQNEQRLFLPAITI